VLRVGNLAAPLAALVLAVVLLGGGCVPKAAEVSAVWPPATVEATTTPTEGIMKAPLTGEPVAETVVTTVPTCVKVRQSAAGKTWGVGAADVVYETGDAGGDNTRLACLYSGDVPKRIGPIAAVGMPDLWIVPQYRAMLFSAGATASLDASLQRWPYGSDAAVTRGSPFDDAYSQKKSQLFLTGSRARKLADRHASSITSAGPARLQFSESVPESATAIAHVAVPFSKAFAVGWKWDEKSDGYLRAVNKKTAVDSLGGKPISARNVVVMWARYSALDSDLAGDGGYDVTLGASGQASVFRDGIRIDGRWSADGDSPPRLMSREGSSIRLGPGRTWFEVIPLSANITMR
jgi:hypothetical protein